MFHCLSADLARHGPSGVGTEEWASFHPSGICSYLFIALVEAGRTAVINVVTRWDGAIDCFSGKLAFCSMPILHCTVGSRTLQGEIKTNAI